MDRHFEEQTDDLLKLIKARWKCTLCGDESLNWPDGYEIVWVDGIWSPVGDCCLDMVYSYFADRWEE